MKTWLLITALAGVLVSSWVAEAQHRPGDSPPAFKLDAQSQRTRQGADSLPERERNRFWEKDRANLNFENHITRFGSISLPDNQRAGEVVAICGNLTIPATAQARDVAVVWGSASVDGRVDGKLVVIGGEITLGPTAEVRGELVNIGKGITQNPGSFVGGGITHLPLPGVGAGSLIGLLLFFAVFGILTAFLAFPLKLMVFAVVPERIQTAASSLGSRNGKSGLVGVLALALLPVFVMFTILTTDAFPLLGVLLIGILTSLTISGAAFGSTTLDYVVGNRLLRGRGHEKPFLAVFLGSLLFAVLVNIPIVGWWVIRPIGYCLAFGISIVTLYGSKDGISGETRPAFFSDPLEKTQNSVSRPEGAVFTTGGPVPQADAQEAEKNG